MIEPIATTVAGLEPDNAAKKAHDNTADSARPPRIAPTSVVAKFTIRVATPPEVRKAPASMKNGIAMIANWSSPVNSRCEMISTGIVENAYKKASTDMPSAIEIGMPVSSRATSSTKMMSEFMPPPLYRRRKYEPVTHRS